MWVHGFGADKQHSADRRCCGPVRRKLNTFPISSHIIISCGPQYTAGSGCRRTLGFIFREDIYVDGADVQNEKLCAIHLRHSFVVQCDFSVDSNAVIIRIQIFYLWVL